MAAGTGLSRWRGVLNRHRRLAALAVLVGVLIIANVLHKFGPAGTGLVLGPVVAAGLLVLARRWGLSWHDLGLARRTWAKGIGYAAIAVAAVVAAYAIGAMLPLTRAAFLDARYQMPTGPALLTALVVIPLGTVLLEEIAFRGVLLGFITRHRGARWGLGFSSALFGLWHILPSLNLGGANPAIAMLAGTGMAARIGVVAAVVAFTALAGWLLGELRRRSGSLFAAAGLHWAVNGVGVLVAMVIYTAGVH
ncbi:MAG TPA: CPBP family intramembrane glutamic endopeptidase [Micromonosporaceae bacterium]